MAAPASCRWGAQAGSLCHRCDGPPKAGTQRRRLLDIFSDFPTFCTPRIKPGHFSRQKNHLGPIIPANLSGAASRAHPRFLTRLPCPSPVRRGKVDASYGRLRRRPQVDTRHWLWQGGSGKNKAAGRLLRPSPKKAGGPPGVLTAPGLSYLEAMLAARSAVQL